MEDFRDVQARAGQMYSRQIVFLSGVSRSALGWVGSAIDAHPDAVCKGECHATDWLMSSLEGALGGYNTKMGQLSDSLTKAGQEADLPGFVEGDLDYLLRSALALCFSRWEAGTGAKVICDRTPETVFAMDRIIQVVPEAKFIHIVRDGRDEAINAWDFNTSSETRDAFLQRYPSFDTFAEAFAETWVQGTGRARQFGRHYWDRYFEFRWEDIIHHPEPGIAALLQFLELRNDPDLVDHCVREARALAPASGHPGQWRELFAPEAIRVFTQKGGELLKLLGYQR